MLDWIRLHQEPEICIDDFLTENRPIFERKNTESRLFVQNSLLSCSLVRMITLVVPNPVTRPSVFRMSSHSAWFRKCSVNDFDHSDVGYPIFVWFPGMANGWKHLQRRRSRYVRVWGWREVINYFNKKTPNSFKDKKINFAHLLNKLRRPKLSQFCSHGVLTWTAMAGWPLFTKNLFWPGMNETESIYHFQLDAPPICRHFIVTCKGLVVNIKCRNQYYTPKHTICSYIFKQAH